MNLILGYLLGCASLFISWYALKDTDRRIGLALFLISAITLQMLGPNSIGFGVFLGSGWILLNEAVEMVTR